MKRYEIVFRDEVEHENIHECYDKFLEYLGECVRCNDVSAFQFFELRERYKIFLERTYTTDNGNTASVSMNVGIVDGSYEEAEAEASRRCKDQGYDSWRIHKVDNEGDIIR